MKDDMKFVALNQPALTEEDYLAVRSWCEDGTVPSSYLDKLLGNPALDVSPQGIPVKILTEEELLHLDFPYPPEPDWSK